MSDSPDELVDATCKLFGLTRIPAESGSSAAVLDARKASDSKLTFELRFVKQGSPVQTARRFSQHYLDMWRPRHWLIGIDRSIDHDGARYYLHATPDLMTPWFESVTRRLTRDQLLVQRAAEKLATDDLWALCGKKASYTRGDLQAVLPGKVENRDQVLSPSEAVELLRERCLSLLDRGNAPLRLAIPSRYFDGWDRITGAHAARLIERVRGL